MPARPMRSVGVTVALAAVALLGAGRVAAQEAAPAEQPQSVWQNVESRDGANPGCSVVGTGSVSGSRMTIGASQRRPSPINLVFSKPSWSIPQGTRVRVRTTFSGGNSMEMEGRGKGQSVEIDLDGQNLRTWLRAFTADMAMEVMFAGSEPLWSFDLVGTTRAVNSLGDCFVARNVVGVPPPFSSTGSDVTGSGAPPASTQPFGGSLPPASAGSRLPAVAPAEAPRPQSRAGGAGTTAPTDAPPPPTTTSRPGSEPASTSPSSAPAQSQNQTVSSDACRSDWRKCRDNGDLVNHYGGLYLARAACKEAANDKASYGTPEWPGFWSGGAFGTYLRGTNYVTSGIVTLIETDAKFQNGFGAMVRSRVFCEYDLNKEQVVTALIMAR